MLRRRLTQRDRGVSSLELAFIAPSLILLIFFVIQAALYFYARSVAQDAAREGVSQLRLDQTPDICNGDVTNIRNDVEAFARHIGSGALEGVTATPHCDKDTVTVEVTGTAISLTGITISVDETVTGRVEHFQDLP
jgi:Flp pilus assembly protein TadG